MFRSKKNGTAEKLPADLCETKSTEGKNNLDGDTMIRRNSDTYFINRILNTNGKRQILSVIIVALLLTVSLYAFFNYNSNDDPIYDESTTSGDLDTGTVLTGVVAIAAGYYHTVALIGDGTVWTWGSNTSGQLGDGTTINRSSPVQVTGLTDIIAIASGQNHSIALKSDGTVWAWGQNTAGQLGNDSATNSSTPVRVTGLTNVTAIAGGYYFSMFLKSDGTLWTCGNNQYGQLGNGLSSIDNNSSTPVQVIGLTNVTAMAGGYYHAVAVKSDGTVWAWGQNTVGQLGNGYSGADYNSSTPVQVTGLTGVTAIACGNNHTIALKSDGTVWAWGYNNSGQLGNNSTTNSSTPVQVIGLTDVTAVDGNYYYGIALKKDGTLWAWGNNDNGQLGDGTATNSSTAAQVIGIADVIKTAAGYYHVVALRIDGSLWAWGNNLYGQLASDVGGNKSSPVEVTALTNVIAVDSGTYHTIALKSDGTVWTWGYNNHGQLSGTITSSITPVQVVGLTNIIAIAAGDNSSFAVQYDGTVWAWGYNANGQLGLGDTTDRSDPVHLEGITDVIAISSGQYHTIALKSDGTVWAWGYNYQGQLGLGDTTRRTTPVPIDIADVVAVGAGQNHTIALKSDKTVWTWGNNQYGQLGDGTTTNSSTPIQVAVLTDAISVACGQYHTIAVKSDGTVWTWGNNQYGQLGDGTTTNSSDPVQAIGVTNAISVAGGQYHTIALKSDRTACSWGYNSTGQLSIGVSDTDLHSIPEQTVRLTDATVIASGSTQSFAIDINGTLWSWGQNTYGQLGIGEYLYSSSVIQSEASVGTDFPPANSLNLTGASDTLNGLLSQQWGRFLSYDATTGTLTIEHDLSDSTTFRIYQTGASDINNIIIGADLDIALIIDGVTLTGNITIGTDSHLTLYLSGINVINGSIIVPTGTTLTIADDGGGSLSVTATSAGNAAIGGANGQSAGTISINGGTVTATGNGGGAGIGGGKGGNGAILKIESSSTVTAYADGGKYAIDTRDLSGSGYFVNAYLSSALSSSASVLSVYSTKDTADAILRLNLPGNYTSFAFHLKDSDSTATYEIEYVGDIVHKLLRSDGSSDIPSVNSLTGYSSYSGSNAAIPLSLSAAPVVYFTLNLGTSDNGTIQWSGDGKTWEDLTGPETLEQGTQVYLRPNADSDYVFSYWTDDAKGNTNPTVITISKDTTVSAIFILEENAVTLNHETTDDGSFEWSFDAEEWYEFEDPLVMEYGTDIYVKPVPGEGSSFDGLTGDTDVWERNVEGDSEYYKVTLTSDMIVGALFSKVEVSGTFSVLMIIVVVIIALIVLAVVYRIGKSKGRRKA